VKTIRPTTRFRRDYKRALKRGKDSAKLEVILDAIAKGEPLEARTRTHRLKGIYDGLFECHIEPDWLLIWDDQGDDVILVRCGTHADLFE
jgi:mRNA interferase YafQ